MTMYISFFPTNQILSALTYPLTRPFPSLWGIQ